MRLEHELISYFQTSIFNGDIEHAEKVLRKQDKEFVTADMFHIFLRTYIKRGLWNEFVELLRHMESQNVSVDVTVYALTLAAYGQLIESNSSASATRTFLHDSALSMSSSLNLSAMDVLHRRALLVEEKRLINVAASMLCQDSLNINGDLSCQPARSLDYDCPIVDHFNEKNATYPNPNYGAFDLKEMKSKLKEIWRLETHGQVFADRVDNLREVDDDDSSLTNQRLRSSTLLSLHREIWRKSISEALDCHLSVLKKKRFDENIVSLHPYLNLFTAEEMTDFLVSEIDQIVLWTHQMAFPNHVLAARIGRIFAIRAAAKQHALFGDFETFEKIYSRYLEFHAAETRQVWMTG